MPSGGVHPITLGEPSGYEREFRLYARADEAFERDAAQVGFDCRGKGAS